LAAMTASRMAGATPAALSLAKFMHVLLTGGAACSPAGFAGRQNNSGATVLNDSLSI
jgi:hypothetical protein